MSDPIRLEFERRKRKWSQATVAHLADLTQPEVCLIEQGRLIPTPDQLERLGQVFQITPARVLLKTVTVRDPEEADEYVESTQVAS